MKAMFGLLRRRRLAVVTVAIFAVAGGIAYGSIPDAGGVYHACVTKTGSVRIIDSDTDQCRSVETAITFNQKGQPGDPGQSPTVAQVAAGDSHCAAGGAAITDAAGTTAYVCSGANGKDGTNGTNGTDGTSGTDGTPFSGTFTSPNGQYSINVADTGVTISGAGSTVNLSDSGLSLESSTGLKVQAGGTLTLGGALLTLNGSGPTCLRAARLGDSILATSASQGALSTGFITSGSSTVCIGG